MPSRDWRLRIQDILESIEHNLLSLRLHLPEILENEANSK